MANNQKRQHDGDPSQGARLTKLQRIDEKPQNDRDPDNYLITWRYPPEYWDNLSRLFLEYAALDELNRRNRCIPPSYPSRPTVSAEDFLTTTPQALARFARHGGPDLCDLRGYPEPIQHRTTHAMSSSHRSRATRSTDPTSVPTKPTTTTTKTKSKTAYDRAFEQHLVDHNISPTWDSQRPDLGPIQEALVAPRPSLSPSEFSEGAFSAFRRSHDQAKDEADVLTHVIPIITGTPSQNDHPSAMNIAFGHLQPFMDGTAVPKPDLYYGSRPGDLNPAVRDELGHHIIPSTMTDRPMLPNMFLEVKGPDGSAAVMLRQARYDGAVGARGMHSLQNFNVEEPTYDGVPRTFSSTYHSGMLSVYAHHVTAPATPEDRPGYHMTQVRSFAMTDDRETCAKGTAVFRNTRDIAKKYRNDLISTANSKAQRSEGPPAQDDESSVEEYMEPYDGLSGAPQLIARSQEPYPSLAGGLTDEPLSTSFTSSFTSAITGPSKRQRSPPTAWEDGVSTSRMRPSTGAFQASSASNTLAQAADPSASCWVETYWRKGILCFKNLQGQEIKTELKDWSRYDGDGGQPCFYWRSSKSGREFRTLQLAAEPSKSSRARP